MAKINPLERLEFDLSLNSSLILGIDEVGWGCIAGGLTLGGCLIESSSYLKLKNEGNNLLSIIRDSKKVTPKNRALIFNQVNTLPVKNFIGQASVEEINEVGLAAAYDLALGRLLAQVPELKKALIILDGSRIPKLLKDLNCQLIIKGDDKSLAIGIASIVAKETRDEEMNNHHLSYPEYDLSENKGYGTPNHISALKKHGITPIHRNKGTSTILS